MMHEAQYADYALTPTTTLKAHQICRVSIVRFAELLSKIRTNSTATKGDYLDVCDVPPKGRHGYILTDYLPPVKMTKIYHRLRELQDLKVKDFQMRFGGIDQWSVGIMVFSMEPNDMVAFYIEQFGEDKLEHEL